MSGWIRCKLKKDLFFSTGAYQWWGCWRFGQRVSGMLAGQATLGLLSWVQVMLPLDYHSHQSGFVMSLLATFSRQIKFRIQSFASKY